MEGTSQEERPPRVPGWAAVRRLGAGADAEVWEVEGAAGERAALKVPLPGGEDSLLQETEALRHHRHRHLVAPLGQVQTDRGRGLLSELLPGGSLAALVRSGGPLPAARMRTAVVPVAQALQSLHAEGIVHGDVSPSNILFDVDGRPALADLGASRLLGGPSRGAGTPGFAAPEVLDPDGVAGRPVSAGADVYSLGAVAWFALTGRAPGALQDRAPLPVLVPEADAELGDLLDGCLDPDPARRPSAEEFAGALYATGPCEPVLLHASATPEVALVLPTVRSDDADCGRRGRLGRPRGPRGRSRALQRTAGRARGPRARLLAGACALAAALAAAALVHHGSGGSGQATTDPGAAASSVHGQGSPDIPRERPTTEQPTTEQPTTEQPTTEQPTTEQPGADDRAEGAPDAAVLDRIAEERTAALRQADGQAVDAYTVAGSEAAHADLALVDRLRRSGGGFQGLTITLNPDGAPEAEAAREPGVVAVPVTLRTSAHRLVDAAGDVLADEPERTDPATLVMEWTGEGWKVSAIRGR
ncbi:serine/threonine-protein kinase [Micrococcus luteus]